jgi:lipid-A-disaccharide synthase
MAKPLRVFLVATEESGDRLGGALMRAIRAMRGDAVTFEGVGGHDMAAEGLKTLFPIGDLAIVGLSAIPKKLPSILRRIRQAAKAALAWKPDVLVIIDSPDFTHRVARLVRRRDPSIPIVDYVSPSVWAWRPGRARAMRRYVDHVLALLPFEPAAHERLGGPPCTYVGHPLIEQVATLRPQGQEAQRRDKAPPVLVVLPGSRSGEIRWMLGPFGKAIELLQKRIGAFELVVPTTPHLAGRVEQGTAKWPVRPRIVVDAKDRHAAFRVARAALAKSGTVTLELALAGVPMVTAYKGGRFEAAIARRVIRLPSVILANLVLGENVVPEFLQENCTPEKLADALVPLLSDTPERRKQVDAFSRLDGITGIGTANPARQAADIVLNLAGQNPRASGRKP